jgi:hypothetical protein
MNKEIKIIANSEIKQKLGKEWEFLLAGKNKRILRRYLVAKINKYSRQLDTDYTNRDAWVIKNFIKNELIDDVKRIILEGKIAADKINS